MENLKTLYSNLTSVNIDEQKKLWDERGKGYYGEYLVFCELYKNIKGISKFLMNVEIPTSNGKTTEIDLMMIHESGIYIFEIKHYKGTIYGRIDDEIWTQYFRTVKNSTFKNPVKQNAYHISALQKDIPNMPIYSIIVFSNEECEIRVSNNNPSLIVTSLSNLSYALNSAIALRQPILSLERVDELFSELLQYSHMREQTVQISETDAVPFYSFIDSIKNDFQAAKNATEKHGNELVKQKKKSKIMLTASIACAVVALSIFAFLSCSAYKQRCDAEVESAMSELREMEKNFEKVDLNDNNNRVLADGMINVNAELKKSEDLKNTLILNFTIKNNAKEYGITISNKSALLITFSDGSVREYSLVEHNHEKIILGGTDNKFYNSTKDITSIEISDVSDISEIEYIKIKNVSIWKTNYTNDATDAVHEFEVYSK